MSEFYFKDLQKPKRPKAGFNGSRKCANFFSDMKFDFRQAILSLMLLLGISLCAFAQESGFESVYGNFSIALPKVTTVTKGFRDDESKLKTAGMIYAWDTGKTVYTIRYSTFSGISKKSATAQERLALEDKAVADTIAQYKGEQISQREFMIAGVKGTEITARVGAGKMTVRNFVIKDHAYSIQAIARNPEDETEAVKRLDSFQVIDGRAVMASQIETVKPEPFAKTDSKWWPSDARSENLRGPVKSVTELWEDLTGDAPQQGSILSSVDTYNRRGINTSRISYKRSTGQPDSLTIFGFLKSVRAMRSTDLEKNSVTRWIRKRFDRKGRVTKETVEDKDLATRTVRYVGNRSYSKSSAGTVTTQTVTTLDRNGDPIESTFEVPELKRKTQSRFRYVLYDRFGNWTKRIVYRADEEGGKISWAPFAVETRTISYFR